MIKYPEIIIEPIKLYIKKNKFNNKYKDIQKDLITKLNAFPGFQTLLNINKNLSKAKKDRNIVVEKIENRGHLEHLVIQAISGMNFWDEMIGMFSSALGVDDPKNKTALQYAIQETEKLFDAEAVNATRDGMYKNLGYATSGYSSTSGHGGLNKWCNKRSEAATNYYNAGKISEKELTLQLTAMI